MEKIDWHSNFFFRFRVSAIELGMSHNETGRSETRKGSHSSRPLARNSGTPTLKFGVIDSPADFEDFVGGGQDDAESGATGTRELPWSPTTKIRLRS